MLGKLKRMGMLDVLFNWPCVATIKLGDYATIYIGHGLVAFQL